MAETANLIVNSDPCFDTTSTITDSLGDSSIDRTVVILPVKYFTAGTTKSEPVLIALQLKLRAFTEEAWIKQNGSFVKVSN